MEATLGIDLLKQPFTVKQMTVGNALAIASVKVKYNERRISLMIDEMADKKGFSATLTAQERYFILLSHHALANNDFVENDAVKLPENYLIDDTMPSDVPECYQLNEIKICHLYGRHLDILDLLHQNGAEWYNGQMACQIVGDISHIIGGDTDEWHELTVDMPENEIRAEIIRRVHFISSLSVNTYESLANTYNIGLVQLTHFVSMGVDNEGITLMAQRGGEAGKPERFCPLEGLRGTIQQLTELISPASNDNDGSWGYEFDGGDES